MLLLQDAQAHLDVTQTWFLKSYKLNAKGLRDGLANRIEVIKPSFKVKLPVSLPLFFRLWFPSRLCVPAGLCFWLLFVDSSLAVVNPACFSSGQFRRRCVQLPHSSSHPRPFLPCLPPSQLPLRSSLRCSSDADYTWWCATPPRLGNGQNAYRPTLLPQVRFNFCTSIDLSHCRFLGRVSALKDPPCSNIYIWSTFVCCFSL